MALQCGLCGVDVAEDMRTIFDEFGNVPLIECPDGVNKKVLLSDLFDEDDKMRELKMLVKMQELGISIEYRCPACRTCSDCKNAPVTERISLREEAEDQAVKDSVKIDFDKKKITCSIPLRGKEEDFLSNNRDIALKVLNSQCKKVLGDKEAKETVIKSFYKLFNGKYARRFNELTEDQRAKILEKPVQHYLPWRVVYKESVSTPCRTVMDASTKTPLKQNGKGGRGLNDLTMKGKENSLDLLNMLLRFQLGPVAFSGDLKQFYTSIALEESQWNLQRVLWRENMDTEAETEEIVIVSLIFGVRSVSALSVRAVLNLADHVRETNPRLCQLLSLSRMVDDLGDSDMDLAKVKDIIDDANSLFESVGLSCKGWSVSGSHPHPDVTHDGISVNVGGMVWKEVQREVGGGYRDI